MKLSMIGLCFLMFSCSLFNHPEEIDIKNPKPGFEFDVKELNEGKR